MGKLKSGFAVHPENINRKGRPPKGESITGLMREHLWNKPEKGKVARKEKFINVVWELAAKDHDLNAIKLIWNYMDGKPTQKIQAQISDGLEGLTNDELDEALGDIEA